MLMAAGECSGCTVDEDKYFTSIMLTGQDSMLCTWKFAHHFSIKSSWRGMDNLMPANGAFIPTTRYCQPLSHIAPAPAFFPHKFIKFTLKLVIFFLSTTTMEMMFQNPALMFWSLILIPAWIYSWAFYFYLYCSLFWIALPFPFFNPLMLHSLLLVVHTKIFLVR